MNLTGTWLAIRAFLRAVVAANAEPQDAEPPPHRSIVTIASVNATIAVPDQAHYVASKGGIAALTKAAALEGAPLGVRVNAIAPGPIRTPMASERLQEPAQVAWLTGGSRSAGSASRRRSANWPSSCLSERASYVSGEVVYADGGWAANAV